MKRLHRPDLALLIFAALTLAAIFVLLLLRRGVPPELWAVLFATLAAAGVAVVPGAVAAVNTDTSPVAATDASPPAAPAPVAPASSTAPGAAAPRWGGVGDGPPA